MYQRTGSYWESQSEEERWTFCCGEGILFPCYNKDGYLYRFRIKNEYPDIKIKEGDLAFQGKYGRFHHSYDKDGKHCWSFKEQGSDSYLPVYGPGSNNTLSLNEKGLPSLGGKADGKYANISSVKEIRLENGRVVNMFHNGCRSGSPYSLYYQEGDSFKIVLGSEGEKKGMIANYIKKCPLVHISGVSAYSTIFEKDENGESLIDWLKKRGMKYFAICYDADKESNERVAQAEKALAEELIRNDVIPLIGEWKGKFNKGIDDILLMGLDISIKRA